MREVMDILLSELLLSNDLIVNLGQLVRKLGSREDQLATYLALVVTI